MIIEGKLPKKYADLLKKAAEIFAENLENERAKTAIVELDFVKKGRIRRLNRQFRGIDRVTDVLSFPYIEGGVVGSENELVGSIIICAKRAKEQAKEYNHSPEREIIYLFVHGLWHLFGCDHISEADKIQMRQKEEIIMEKMNLTRESE